MSKHTLKSTMNSQMIFFILLLTSFIGVLLYIPRLSIPMGASYLVYLILSPCIPLAMRLGLSKTQSVVVVLASLVALSIIPMVKLGPSASLQIKNIQYYLPKLEKYIHGEYSKATMKINELTGLEVDDRYISDGMNYVNKATQSFLLNIPKLLANIMEWVFLVPLFVFFLLIDSGKFKHLMLRVTPNSIFERFYYVTHQFNKQIGDYIFAKFIEASLVGLIITTGLWLMDIRFSLLLGLVAGATNIIPYLGPLLGMAPAFILALAEYGMGTTFGAIAILYTVANAIDIAIVFPILVSKIVDLHPILVVTSVILGSQALGVIGMVISIPCAAALKLILKEIYNEIYSSFDIK